MTPLARFDLSADSWIGNRPRLVLGETERQQIFNFGGEEILKPSLRRWYIELLHEALNRLQQIGMFAARYLAKLCLGDALITKFGFN